MNGTLEWIHRSGPHRHDLEPCASITQARRKTRLLVGHQGPSNGRVGELAEPGYQVFAIYHPAVVEQVGNRTGWLGTPDLLIDGRWVNRREIVSVEIA